MGAKQSKKQEYIKERNMYNAQLDEKRKNEERERQERELQQWEARQRQNVRPNPYQQTQNWKTPKQLNDDELRRQQWERSQFTPEQEYRRNEEQRRYEETQPQRQIWIPPRGGKDNKSSPMKTSKSHKCKDGVFRKLYKKGKDFFVKMKSKNGKFTYRKVKV